MIALFAIALTTNIASVDTTAIGDPMGSLWRSAVVPGWGQVHNGQAYKVPFVLAGIGGLVALAVYNHNEFESLNEAYLYGVYMDDDPHPFPEYENSYLEYEGVSTSSLRAARDKHLRNRDLAIIGSVAFYALNVLDAYVNGHLVGFDVSEDLSAHFVPNPMQPTARLTFRF